VAVFVISENKFALAEYLAHSGCLFDGVQVDDAEDFPIREFAKFRINMIDPAIQNVC